MSFAFLDSTARTAWGNATTQTGQLAAFRALWSGDVSVRYYTSGGTHLGTATHAGWDAIDTGTTPYSVTLAGRPAPWSHLADGTAAYCIVAVPGGADIIRADASLADAVSASTGVVNLDDAAGAAGLRINAAAGLPSGALGYSVPSGEITNITSANGRADVSPQLDTAANPDFPSAPPYFNGRGWSTVMDYAGAVFASDVGANGTYMLYGGAGHVAVNALFWFGFDVTDRTWKRIGDQPPQTNGLVGLTFPGGVPDWDAMYALGGVYGAFNNTYGDWNGDHASMPSGFRLTGKTTIPAGSHSRNRMAYRPASAAGNTKGEIVVGWHMTEYWDYTGVGTAHTWDGETETWARHANQRYSHEAKSGGLVYHAAHDVICGPNFNDGATGFDFFDCATQTWVHRTYSSGGRSLVSDSTAFGWTDGSGFAWHVLCNPLNSLAPAQSFFAVRVDRLVSNTSPAWVDLTVTATTTWPATSLSGSGIPSYAYTVCWAHCPSDGCYYAVNREHGSNKLWKLTPPVSGVITDSWVITETTLGGTTLSAAGANGTDQISWDYNRLQWVPALSAFLWIGNRLDAPVQAIRPIGV